MKNDLILRDLGRAYADQAVDFLREKHGSQMPMEELLSFYREAAAWMVAGAFSAMYNSAPAAEAEIFLKTVFSSISASIRIKKIPVLVKAELTMTPLESPQKQEPEPEPKPPALPAEEQVSAPACSCRKVGKDCVACREQLKEMFGKISVVLLKYMKTMGEYQKALTETCSSCAQKYTDFVLAEIIKKGSPEINAEPEELILQMLAGLIQMGAMTGIQEAPLAQAELEKRMKG